MNYRRLATFLSCAAAAWCVTGPVSGQESGEVLSGERVYQLFCGVCHGPTGKGSPFGKNLTSPDSRALSDEDIETVIIKGRPDKGMMSFSTLNGEEMRGVVAYIRKLQGVEGYEDGGSAAVNADAGGGESNLRSEGQKLFEGAAGCAECHSVQMEGGVTGPDLDEVGLRLSAEGLREALTEPSKTFAEGYETKTAVLPDGTAVHARYRNETAETIQLLNERGDLWTTYFKKDLQDLAPGKASLMPEDAFTKLSGMERTAIMKFLATLR